MDHEFRNIKPHAHRGTFDTYEVIASCNVYLDDDSVVKLIRMNSIVVEVMVRGKIKRICIKEALMG